MSPLLWLIISPAIIYTTMIIMVISRGGDKEMLDDRMRLAWNLIKKIWKERD